MLNPRVTVVVAFSLLAVSGPTLAQEQGVNIKRRTYAITVEADKAGAEQAAARLAAASQRIARLRDSGDTSAKTLEAARVALAEAEAAHKELTTTHLARIDNIPGGSLSAKHSLNVAREAFGEIERNNDVTKAAATEAKRAEHSAAVKAIHGRYDQQAVTGKRHAKNIGRFIWSNEEIGMDLQDRLELCDTFALTDPIYGRLYVARSLGSTPVYYQGVGEPRPNRRLGFLYKLYINGQDTADKHGAFREGAFRGEFGESKTTWQFAPHPIPPDPAFRTEAEGWRKATKDLPEGRYHVRIELWGTSDNFRTRDPMAVGEFNLVVGSGQRIAPGGRFPVETYAGGDLVEIKRQIRQALIGPVTTSADEILKVSVTGTWEHGRHPDTKLRYRTIRAAVLWADTDDDQLCRYHTYKFIADEQGNNWEPLKYRSFGSPEGEIERPNR